jgi:hypothetical protein
VELRIRDDYPPSVAAAKAAADALAARLAQAARDGRPLGELKALSDAWERPFYAAQGLHRSWTGQEWAGRAGATFAHPLFILRLGTAVIAGLPGEPFGGYSVRMRRETIGERAAATTSSLMAVKISTRGDVICFSARRLRSWPNGTPSSRPPAVHVRTGG